MDNVIYFCKTTDIYGFMSNFAPYGFEIKGIRYKTSEHFYQSCKAVNIYDKDKIIRAATPKEAANIGRSLAYIRRGWDDKKIFYMLAAVLYKFTQNKSIQERLILTGSAEIIEDRDDPYWGRGRGGKGKNILGKILMVVRDYLREQNEGLGW